MGYILLTPKKYGNAVVTWNESRRVDGKRNPTRVPTYLGLLSDDGKELIKGACVKELSSEMLAALAKKGLNISEQAAAPRGRRPKFLRRTTLAELEDTRIQTVGTYRILHGLATSNGLWGALSSAFEDEAEAIFALICQRLDSKMQSYLFKDWAEDSPFELVRLSMSPKGISSLLSGIEEHRLDFAKHWYQACSSPCELIEDSTHFCTYASPNGGRECEEYGWDHHQEVGKRQINVMSLVDRASRLPIMYRAYPGSINDISTFLETSEEFKVIGKDASILYDSDSGYFSCFNMLLMKKSGNDFIMEAKWDLQTLAILSKNRDKLKGVGAYVKHGQHTYRYEPCCYILYDKSKGGNKSSVQGYIYYAELEACLLKNSMVSTILQWRGAFSKYAFESAEQAKEWLDTSTDGWGKFLKLGGAWPNLHLEMDNALVDKATDRFGFHVILSSKISYSAEEVLDICHGRDPIEKLWRTMKTDLNAKTLKTKLDATTQGQIFIVWCAAVLQRLLTKGLARANLDMTCNEALMAMRKVQLTCMPGNIIPCTPTKKAKEIIVGLELEKHFPEFALYLKTLRDEREKKTSASKSTRRKGRPPKFKLKSEVDLNQA